LSEPPDHGRRILGLLRHGPRTRSDLEAATGMLRTTVLYRLRRLRDAGQVELVGKERSKTAQWRSTETGE
jgi:DNA-binding transcriptional ArsR family regulator